MIQNPYSWNKKANVLYIDNPAGVGYSLAKTDLDKSHNDYNTSTDLIVAMESFYLKFPTLRANELYLTGISYAGIYVPYLAW